MLLDVISGIFVSHTDNKFYCRLKGFVCVAPLYFGLPWLSFEGLTVLVCYWLLVSFVLGLVFFENYVGQTSLAYCI